VRTTVTEREDSKVLLEVEVPREEVEQALEAAVRALAKQVRIPGFRKGKIPREVIVQRVGMEGIVHQMLDERLSDWYQEAIRESGIEPVDRPEVDFEDAPESGKSFTFQATVQVMPKPELGEYKGLEVPRLHAEVADEEVDRQVDRLREEFAELRVVEGRPVQEGDFVTMDFAGTVEGEPVEQAAATDYVLEVGSQQLLPDLEQALVGMAAGEEKQAPVSFPEDYHAEDLRGKTVDFEVKVKEVKEKVLPSLNDDFAKDVSEFETLLELRLDIRKKLQSSRDTAVERQYRSAAVKQAADNATVELPEAVIDQQAGEMVEEFAHSLAHQGTDLGRFLEMTGQNVERLLSDVRPQAEDQVRQTLVLEAVAEAEGLELVEEELEKRFDEMAAVARMEPAQFRSALEESGKMRSVRQQLLREKAADFIVEHAVPVAPPEDESESPQPEAPTTDEADTEGGAERTAQ
jgi:trigger factor